MKNLFFLRIFFCVLHIPFLVFGTIHVSDKPSTVIDKTTVLLTRPEGLAFSPDGQLLAASDNGENMIVFFKRIGNNGGIFEKEPCFSIGGINSQLGYPHDLCFSPDGQHLAVANSEMNQILIYKKSIGDAFFDLVPVAVIQGRASELNNPRSIKYAPIENFIAVANGGTNTITLYHYQGDMYEQAPYQMIDHNQGLLVIPDGLSITSDGKFLAVTSHGTHAVALFAQISNTQGIFSPKPVQVLKSTESDLRYPHSLSFEKSGEYLAVSNACGPGLNEGEMSTVNIFKKASKNDPGYLTVPECALKIYEIQSPNEGFNPEEGGIKGCAFSPDGDLLALSSAGLHKHEGKIFIYRVRIE